MLRRMLRPERKQLNLALQGGGAHGAFTWGVIDYLLEDGRIDIAGVTGTSAGAVNAVMLADGLARGGDAEARTRLADFWRAASIGGNLPDSQRAVMERLISMMPAAAPMQFIADAMARFMSPYDINPLNINPLKELIERFADFEAIRAFTKLDLFVSATNVHSGRLRVFRREEMTADMVMASAALPRLFRAVEIGGEPYWDGGFTANPAILPLVEANAVSDLLIVQISPTMRETTPTTPRAILARVGEIVFNASLDSELRALDYIGRAAGSRRNSNSAGRIGRVNVHRVALKISGKKLEPSSGLNTSYDFFTILHRAGRRAARNFLDEHFDDIGRRSTLDLAKATATAATTAST